MRELPLGVSGPIVGSSLVFEGREWQVIGRSNYRSDEGYRVAEWTCETGGETAYLLRETDAKRQLMLALGPAALGGLAACLIAGVMLRASG